MVSKLRQAIAGNEWRRTSRSERQPKSSRPACRVRAAFDPEFQAETKVAARDLEMERDERIALSGAGHLVDENEKLTKQVALLDRRIAALLDDLRATKSRESMWKERAIEAGWKARADA